MATPVRFTNAFICPNCRQPGSRTWEEGADGARQTGSTRVYVSVSDGFHREEGRSPSGEPVVVCDRCDEIQPD